MASLDNGKKIGLINHGESSHVDALTWHDCHNNKQGQTSGEEKLKTGLLNDSLKHLEKFDHVREKPRIVREIIGWIREENLDYPFSFHNCCEASGLNCEAVRKELLKKYS